MIPAGHNSLSFDISITDDSVFEGYEDFYLMMNQSSSLNDVIIGSQNRTLIKIIDNECK